MADEAFAPRIGFACSINCVRGILAADDLKDWAHLISLTVLFHWFRIPMRVLVAKTSLAKVIETPSVELPTIA